jgi:hypothetical protein
MKASELRIGNIIEHPHKGARGYVYVTARIISDIESTNNSIGYKPILLTEEWLKKLGFEKYTDGWYLDKGEYPKQITVSLFDDNGFHLSYFKTPIQYVHQLQNLYFALTGEELTIKQNVEN